VEDNFKNKLIKRKKIETKNQAKKHGSLIYSFTPAVLCSVSQLELSPAIARNGMGGRDFCYLVWRLMTGKKADYPRSKSQLEIQKKGARVCGSLALTTTALTDDGVWLPHTGHPDWCEKNYAWTIYIAEFWNNLSSIPLALVGAWGLYHCFKFNCEFQFVLCNLILMFVGIGSTAFHGTLSYEGQCLDELAMIYCALVFAHTLLGGTWFAGIGLGIYAVAFTVIYFNMKDSGVFQLFIVLYALTVLALVVKSYQYAHASGNAQLVRIVTLAGSVYIGGFLFLWIPEHLLCVIPTTDSDRPKVIEAVQVCARLVFVAVFT
jgi:dihydroceramidase